VYYLIAVWLFISTVAMFAFTHTPLGRICNAVRDNPERAEFVGYNTQWVRYLTLIVSAFFAGVSGGLSAINFEIVTAENVSAVRSGAVLLFTFIGGIGFFFGPMIGAVIGVFLTVMLSDLTKAWQLYLGLFFILIVMFAPGGIASLIMLQLRVMAHGMLRRIALPLLKVSLSCVLAFCGLVMLIEMLYQRSLEQAGEPVLHLLGITLSVQSWQDWTLAMLVLLSGAAGFFFFSKPYMHVWSLVNTEIEEKIRRSQA
jgi:branched-chain amino acid transport system permease protein